MCSDSAADQAPPAVVHIVGVSNSGKTTLIERLISRLTARGLQVGVIKHAHEGFTLDQRGKDSQRCWEAGARAVVVAGPEEVVVRQHRAWATLSELLGLVPQELDCVLIEGFTHTANAIDVPVAVQVELTAEGVRLNGRLVAVDAALGAVEAAIVKSLQGAHRQTEHHRAARRERLQQATEEMHRWGQRNVKLLKGFDPVRAIREIRDSR